MSVEDAREKLEAEISSGYMLVGRNTKDVIMGLADALRDTRELRGHKRACRNVLYFGVKNETLSSPGHTRCGQSGWYCSDAPVKEVTA